MKYIETKGAIVINEEGYKIDNVALLEDGTPFKYTLNEGKSIILKDIDTAITMNKPKWENEKWVETELQKESEFTEGEVPQPPTELELAIKELTLMIEQLNNSNSTSTKNIESDNEMEILNNESVTVRSWVNLVKTSNTKLKNVPNLFNLKNIVEAEVNNQ